MACAGTLDAHVATFTRADAIADFPHQAMSPMRRYVGLPIPSMPRVVRMATLPLWLCDVGDRNVFGSCQFAQLPPGFSG